MKYTAAILSAAAAVSATSVFQVSDFAAGCIPHSTQCSYSFGVLQIGNGETTPVKCSAMVGSDNTLPAVTAGTCADSSRTFTVTKGTDGLTLAVSQPVSASSSTTASHLLSNSDLATATDPNAEVQSYTGATSFTLDN